MINYKHLHYFLEVAKNGSIARTSGKLHITPQTISGQFSLLEEYWGKPLPSRAGRNLELTETGASRCHSTTRSSSSRPTRRTTTYRHYSDIKSLFNPTYPDTTKKAVSTYEASPVGGNDRHVT